jgi:hypothetical protein
MSVASRFWGISRQLHHPPFICDILVPMLLTLAHVRPRASAKDGFDSAWVWITGPVVSNWMAGMEVKVWAWIAAATAKSMAAAMQKEMRRLRIVWPFVCFS